MVNCVLKDADGLQTRKSLSSKMEKQGLELDEYLPINNNQRVTSSSRHTNDAAGRKYTESDNDKVPLDDSLPWTANPAQRWRRAAMGFAWASVFSLLILGGISFVLSAMTASSAAFGFGFGCVLDVFTSVVVIWRFFGSVTTLYSEQRERIALLFLAIFFLVASLSIIVRDLIELFDKIHTKSASSLCVLAAISGTVCALLAIGKFITAKKLESQTVKSDGFSSLAGSITAYSILVSAAVIETHPNVWYLDNIVGFCVAALLTVYGVMLLMQVLSHNCAPISGRCCCCCTVTSTDTDLEQ
ncbi:transmembrane protein 163-like isoform X2 [Acanthaster planci]|uniref:Transmembrane protein 163-like isoform X2 n=1 Tax=Acanthaster planci TaxID=133434 RepID=A0A8B8A7R5_ACAPL|nr:transmembrane protein 163-like isoform X2 [Acanthaster planci]